MNDVYEGLIIEARELQFSGCDCCVDFEELLPVMEADQEYLNRELWFEEISEVLDSEDEDDSHE